MPRAVLGIAFALVASLAALLGLLAAGGGLPVSRLPSARADAPSSFADVVERVNPGVVSIVVRQERERGADEEDALGFGPRRGEGSGFVVVPRRSASA